MSQPESPPDRSQIAWLIVWTVWGSILGLLVYFFDGTATTSLNWLSAGIFIGSCGLRLLRPLATPFHEWYERLGGGEHYLDRMLATMMEAHGQGLSEEELRERLEEFQESKEFGKFMENSLYGMTLAISPLFGLFYGTLIGGVLGALCPISPELHITSARGALLGVAVGTMFVSFIASATCAVIHPSPKYAARSVGLKRRLKILTSPVLIVPAVLHCLKKVARKTG